MTAMQHILGRTHGRILDFSFRGRTESRYAMALYSFPGDDFGCDLHHFSKPDPFKGSWGQIWLENGPN
jgi:hypothetical protein